MPFADQKVQSVAAGTVQAVTGSGIVKKAVVETVLGAGAINVYDNTSTTGDPIFTIPNAAAAGTVYDINVPFSTGLRIVQASTGKVTFTYQGG